MRYLGVGVLCITLGGCFGPSANEIAMQDSSTCEGMGLKYGTPEFAQCRMLMLQRRDNADAAARANAVAAMNNFNATVQNNRVDYSAYNVPMQPIGRPSVTCQQTLAITPTVVCR
jgi:hypothetical protein